MDRAGELFGRLVARPQGVFAYGIYDAVSAKVAENAGHEILYVGGYAAAGSRMLPDMGLLSVTEMLNHIKFIAESVSVPLMVDIDDGYGNANNVIRTVSHLLSIPNIGAFHIEDQRYPKRCGHIKGKDILPLDEFLGKLQAAVETRDKVNRFCKIIARTDAFSRAGGNKDVLTGGDVDEAVRRLVAYHDTGADYLWCEFPSASVESAREVSARVKNERPSAVFAFNVSPSFSKNDWEKSELTDKRLIEMGYKLLFATYPSLSEVVSVVQASAEMFRNVSPVEAMKELKQNVAGTAGESIMKLVGVDRYLGNERRFDPRGEEKQKTSEGFGSDPVA